MSLLLLDTHLLIWAAAQRLPPAADQLVNDASHRLAFSVVSN